MLTYLSAFLGILCGCIPPCLSLLLGNMMNSLNLRDEDSFNSAVNQVSTFMLILGCCSAFLSYTYTTCGMISAENQAIRLRKDYFKALLRQEMSWIDVNQPGEAASRLAEDTVTFQVPGSACTLQPVDSSLRLPCKPAARTCSSLPARRAQMAIGEQLCMIYFFLGQSIAGTVIGFYRHPPPLDTGARLLWTQAPAPSS
jgi:hypothetical protein